MVLISYLNACLLAAGTLAQGGSEIVECARGCYAIAVARHGSVPSACNQMVIRDIADCAALTCNVIDLAHLSTHFALSCLYSTPFKQKRAVVKRGGYPPPGKNETSSAAPPPPTSSTSYPPTSKPSSSASPPPSSKSSSPPPSSSGKPPPPPPVCKTYNPCITKTTTTVVETLITFCPTPTVITVNHKTFTVTAPTTLTITNCPCTVTSSLEVQGTPTTTTAGSGGETGGSVAPSPTGVVVSTGDAAGLKGLLSLGILIITAVGVLFVL